MLYRNLNYKTHNVFDWIDDWMLYTYGNRNKEL